MEGGEIDCVLVNLKYLKDSRKCTSKKARLALHKICLKGLTKLEGRGQFLASVLPSSFFF